MSIIIQYLKISKKYQELYGRRTVLLYQVGSFFEIYSIIHSQSNEISGITEIEEVGVICNLNIANKHCFVGDDTNTKIPLYNGNIDEWIQLLPKSQIVMCGFRDYSLEKYLQILTDSKYTAIVYVQDKEGANSKGILTRNLEAVYSPGTYISESASNILSNNIMSIWFEHIKSKSTDQLLVGCAAVNIFTGESSVFEYDTNYDINPTTFDQLDKFVSELNPNEIIVLHNFKEESVIDVILQYIGIGKIPIHKIDSNINVKSTNCTKQTYLQHIITTFFDAEAYTSCGFYRNQFTTQAFCFLLNFIQEHNSDLVRKINLPIFRNTSKKLILANHTLRQLNIIDDMCVALMGNGIKIPLPPKVPSGSHQCYSHLCLLAIFYITIYFLRLFFIFLIFSRGTPFTLFDYFPCYPLHFIRFLLYFYFTFYFSFFDCFTWYPLHFIHFYLPVTPFVLWVFFM